MKIILKKGQFKKLNEEQNINLNLNSTGSTTSAIANAITQNQPAISDASKTGNPILHITNPNSSNGTDDNKPAAYVNVQQNQDIETAAKEQLPSGGVGDRPVTIGGPGVTETARYTKKMVEEARQKIFIDKAVRESIKKVLNKK